MGNKYTVCASHYPYKGWWEINKGFETLDEIIEYVKQCQSSGYVIVDIKIRDFEVDE